VGGIQCWLDLFGKFDLVFDTFEFYKTPDAICWTLIRSSDTPEKALPKSYPSDQYCLVVSNFWSSTTPDAVGALQA